MNQMKKHLERCQEQLQEAQEQLEIVEALPVAIRDRAKHCQNWRVDEIFVTLEPVKNFTELFEILSCVDVLPVATWKDTFLHFGPLELAESKGVDMNEDDNREISPVWLSLDNSCAYGTQCSANFYVKHSSGIPCHVQVQVHDHGRTVSGRRRDYRGGYRYENCQLTWAPGVSPGMVKKYAAGSPQALNAFVEYFDVIGDLRDLREGYFPQEQTGAEA
jgi:hypothetical protein